MAKKAPFFSHDMNARHDPKISAMRSVYGPAGYGWFWMLVEMMAESDGYKLDCKSKYTFNAYAMQLQCTSDAVHQFVTDCITEFELFESDGMYFWSNSLRKRMQYRDTVAEKRAEAANKRWGNQSSDANASKNNANASENDSNAMQNDANETKQNETKQNHKDMCFEQFWKAYPSKGSVKKLSKAKWDLLWGKGHINMDEILSGVERYVNHQQHKGYSICAAQVFLNQERWKDDWSIDPSTSISEVVQSIPIKKNDAEKMLQALDIQYGERIG